MKGMTVLSAVLPVPPVSSMALLDCAEYVSSFLFMKLFWMRKDCLEPLQIQHIEDIYTYYARVSFSLPERVDAWELAQKPILIQILSLASEILMLKISSIGIRAFLGSEELFFYLP